VEETAPQDQTKTCFVAAPLGEDGSPTRFRSNEVLEHVIGPALAPLDYDVVRADRISESGYITTQIIERLMEADLVIADLTEKNPNVFYELALRHAFKKPCIQICQSGEKIPFDIAGLRTVFFDSRSLGSAKRAIEEIAAHAKAAEREWRESGRVESPVSVAVDRRALEQSENPNDRVIAALQDEVAEIRRQLFDQTRQFASYANREHRGVALSDWNFVNHSLIDPDAAQYKRHQLTPRALIDAEVRGLRYGSSSISDAESPGAEDPPRDH
jgi:hypothetical protein